MNLNETHSSFVERRETRIETNLFARISGPIFWDVTRSFEVEFHGRHRGTSVTSYQTIKRYIPADSTLQHLFLFD
jgi:hypothetical protein